MIIKIIDTKIQLVLKYKIFFAKFRYFRQMEDLEFPYSWCPTLATSNDDYKMGYFSKQEFFELVNNGYRMLEDKESRWQVCHIYKDKTTLYIALKLDENRIKQLKRDAFLKIFLDPFETAVIVNPTIDFMDKLKEHEISYELKTGKFCLSQIDSNKSSEEHIGELPTGPKILALPNNGCIFNEDEIINLTRQNLPAVSFKWLPRDIAHLHMCPQKTILKPKIRRSSRLLKKIGKNSN